MDKNNIINEYFEWMTNIVCGKRFSGKMTCLEGPCSVLEMMAALAIRIEETIMDNPALGDRTGQWFWGMITTMGLGAMNDNNFDKKSAGNIVNTFLDRQYGSDGDGGLFRIRGVDVDLTKVDIWTQLCWYLDSIS